MNEKQAKHLRRGRDWPRTKDGRKRLGTWPRGSEWPRTKDAETRSIERAWRDLGAGRSTADLSRFVQRLRWAYSLSALSSTSPQVADRLWVAERRAARVPSLHQLRRSSAGFIALAGCIASRRGIIELQPPRHSWLARRCGRADRDTAEFVSFGIAARKLVVPLASRALCFPGD